MMSLEMLNRFEVEVTHPDEMGMTDLRFPQLFEMARAAIGESWRCKARTANTGANHPQDCDWPLCGCDPYADRVIEKLEESGFYVVPASGDNFEMIAAGVAALEGMPRDPPENCVLAVYEAMVERSQKP